MERIPKKYISVDIEASGRYPWNSSMISLGACLVEEKFDKTFYAELMPITMQYELDNFKIGTSSLNCLKDYDFENFNSIKVLDILYARGENPKDVLPRFAQWVLDNTQGYKPVITASPVLFDGMFISYYLDKFYGDNPFGHSGEDIQSVFRGNVRDMKANLEEFGLRENGKLRHNALEDAVQQAKEFYVCLVQMRQNKI